VNWRYSSFLTSIRGKDYLLYARGRVDADLFRKECREERKSKFLSPLDRAAGVLERLPGRVFVVPGVHLLVIRRVEGAVTELKNVATDFGPVSIKLEVGADEQKALVARDFGISRETLYQYLREA
jgi:hypothetical protein